MKTAILAACVCWAFAVPAQVNLKVVSRGLLLTNPPFKACHSSSIVEIRPGNLMVAFFAGTGEGQKDVSIWLARKTGSSWTKPYRIADGVISDSLRYPCWNPVLFKSREGRLFLFYKIGPNPREWWGMVRTSDDEGKTWSVPQKLPDNILGPIKNKPVQLDDGVILNPSSVETDSTWKVHVERSDDLGKTWEKIQVDSSSNFKVIQPAILFHGGGRLQMVCRSDQDSVVDAWSDDNGLSWSKFSKLKLPNPNSGIDAVTLKNGLHVLVYNPEVKGREWFNNRGKLNVAYSSDGKDWKTVLELENTKDKEFSYPAIIQTSDGLVWITYTYNRENVKFVCLKVEHAIH